MGAIFLLIALILAQGSIQNIVIKANQEVSPFEITRGEIINKLLGDEKSSSEELNVEKRDIRFDMDEGSGAVVYNRQNNLMSVTKPPNNEDFTFDNENIFEPNEENVKDKTTITTVNDVTTTSITVPPPQTSTSKSTTTSRESTIVTKNPSCNGISCQDYTAVIQPNHITNEIGSTFQLKCLLGDKMGNATLPEDWKVIWTIKRYQIPPEEVRQPTLTITNSTVMDSGIYDCHLRSTDGCCFNNTYIVVNIYQKPDYALHLLITGAICGIQLLACIPFMIYRRRKVYAYTKTDENEVDDEQKLIA